MDHPVGCSSIYLYPLQRHWGEDKVDLDPLAEVVLEGPLEEVVGGAVGGLPAGEAEPPVGHPVGADALAQDDDDDEGRDEGQQRQLDAALRLPGLDVEVGPHRVNSRRLNHSEFPLFLSEFHLLCRRKSW